MGRIDPDVERRMKSTNGQTKTADVRLRLEPELKDQATRILAGSGLELSIAIRLFLRQVVAHNGLPFDVRQPIAATLRALREAESMFKPRFSSAQELFDALDKGAQRKKAQSSLEETNSQRSLKKTGGGFNTKASISLL